MQDANKTLEPWWELRFAVPKALAEDIAALLVDEGALGVQIQTHRQALLLAWTQHPSMGPIQAAAGLGADEGDEAPQDAADTVYLLASYPHALAANEVVEAATDVLAMFSLEEALTDCAPVRQDDTTWAHAWKAHFRPHKVGRRLWVVPSWETAFVPPTGELTLVLDPGMAFGTGQHPTTALCLRAIEAALEAGEHGQVRVLDVGCGSGILGMAALALGAPWCTLTDVDSAAVAATDHNLREAGFGGRFVAQTDLPPVDGRGFDLVIANILAPVLCQLAPALVAQVALRGTLLLSGILAEQASDVVDAIAQAVQRAGRGAWRVQRRQQGAWVALSLAAGTN